MINLDKQRSHIWVHPKLGTEYQVDYQFDAKEGEAKILGIKFADENEEKEVSLLTNREKLMFYVTFEKDWLMHHGWKPMMIDGTSN